METACPEEEASAPHVEASCSEGLLMNLVQTRLILMTGVCEITHEAEKHAQPDMPGKPADVTHI